MSASKIVLVIEDSPVQAMAITALLEEHDFTVLWAKNGEDGVTMAKTHVPDFIIMDIEMPKMNGFEACKHIKANFVTQDIPIIMLTARSDLEAVNEGLTLGAIDFIPKDILSGSILLDTLSNLEF